MGIGINLGIIAVSGEKFSNNYSLSFDGVDDNITFSNVSFTSDFTFSFWIRPVEINPTDNNYILGKAGSANHYIHLVRPNIITLKIAGSSITFTTSDGDGGNPISLNEWNNIVITRGSSSIVKAFRNGAAFGEATGSLAGTFENDYLGGTTGRLYNGKIDEFAIWDTSDQSLNVNKIYNLGLPDDLTNNGATSPSYWYRFEEGSGTVANNTIAQERVGTINGATFTTDTPNNPYNIFTNTNSILLDGADDYVDCGTNLALLGSATTFSAWVKMRDATSFRVLHKGIAGSREYAFGMGTSDTLFLILYNGSTNYIGKVSTSTMTSYQDQWVHICATYDGSTNASGITLYVNGSVFNSNSISGGSYTAPSGNNNGDVYIGRYNTEYADGNIDETAVFNSQLLQSDITSIYNGGEPNDISSFSPISWWRCGDGDTSPTLTDNGSGGNDGTMTNFSTFSTDVPIIPFSTKSIALDGVDDYINFSQITYAGEFTTSFWIKPDALGASFLVGRQANSDYVWLRTVAQIRIRINFSTYVFSEGSGNNINTGAWNHLLISRDSSNNVSIFLNGASFSTSQVGAGDHRLDQIGKVDTSYYDGNVDETAFWDSDQSSNLASIYNSGVPKDISSLSPTLWYRMGDGDTSPTITDNGSSNNDGTMNNFTTFSTDVPT